MVNNDSFKTNVYYDLSGQKLQTPTKGINIMNGKK